jgi:LCP family protein required for cell wall assembly
MSGTPGESNTVPSASSTHKAPRKRRVLRMTLITLGSLFGFAIAALVGGYAYINHLASSIPRIHVAHLAAAASESSGQTFLMTASPWGLTGTPRQIPSPPTYSKVVMLWHIDADGSTGGAVAIPGDAVVDVPGVGREPLWGALQKGGPSLLVQTVTHLTGVPINHYARLDLNHISSLVDAIGGVDVTLPETTTSFGQTFPAGDNHLTGTTAIYYARQQSLSDDGRLLRVESLLRAVLLKISDDHLITNPATMVNVLNTITSMLTVDSNLTNSEIETLARELGGRSGDGATFVTAPTRTVKGELVLNMGISDQLWTAIKDDMIARFAQKHPSTVTPSAVP